MKFSCRLGRWLLLIIAAWLFVLTIRIIPIGGVWSSLTDNTVLVLSVWLILFIIAYVTSALACKSNLSARNRKKNNSSRVNCWVVRLSVIAVIGAILIAYEFAITRGYGFSTPVALIRIAEVEGSMSGFAGSWVSGFGRLLTPTLLVAWVLTMLQRPIVRRRTIGYLVVATLAVVWQQSMFEGGRFYIAGLLIASAVAWSMASNVGEKSPQTENMFKSRSTSRLALKLFLMCILFCLALVFFGYVFVDRAETSGLDFSSAYQVYNNSYSINITPIVLERLNGPMGAIWFPFMMLWHYLTQGANELDALLHTRSFEYALGLFQFSQIGQIFSKLSGVGLGYDVFSNIPNPGTYTTIYGSSYVDFGHIGTLLSAVILGVFTSVGIQKCIAGNLRGLGLCAPILVALCLFSPVVSLVTNLWPSLFWAWSVGHLINSSQVKHGSIKAAME